MSIREDIEVRLHGLASRVDPYRRGDQRTEPSFVDFLLQHQPILDLRSSANEQPLKPIRIQVLGAFKGFSGQLVRSGRHQSNLGKTADEKLMVELQRKNLTRRRSQLQEQLRNDPSKHGEKPQN